MDIPTFWRFVETAKRESNGDSDLQVRLLTEALTALPETEIIAFDTILESFLARAYTHELWGAAYIMNGGCSNDCFDYFQGWLIAQGEAVFEAALRDPDSLADLPRVEAFEVVLQHMLYVARFAYENKTGQELPARERIRRHLSGQEWDEDDLDTMFPRLTAKYDED